MTQLPANVDIAAPILLIDGRQIDKFMGMTNFVYENPSELLETFEGTVVGVQTNSLTNKVTFQVMVHSTARGSMTFLEGLVRSGVMVPIEVKVPTDKLGMYQNGQVIRRGVRLGLIKGGGTPLGGRNEGPVTFNVEGMDPYQEEKQSA